MKRSKEHPKIWIYESQDEIPQATGIIFGRNLRKNFEQQPPTNEVPQDVMDEIFRRMDDGLRQQGMMPESNSSSADESEEKE